MKTVWRFLSSMQLGITLLLLLAGVSIIGTLFPDNRQAIQSVYASPWYIAIMAFLALNLIICSINRFQSIWNKVFHSKTTAGEKWLKNQANNATLIFSSSPDLVVDKVRLYFQKKRMQTQVNDTEAGTVIYAGKGRFGHFGSLITHISIIMILAGALWGALGRYEDFRLAYPGDTINLEEQGFSVRVDDFRLEYLDDADRTIDQYYCDLSVVDQGQTVMDETIYVNKPLRYEGVNLYQASFGWGARLEIDGVPVDRPLSAGEAYYYEPAHLHVQVMEVYPDFTMNYQGMPMNRSNYPANPYVLYRLYLHGEVYGNNFNLMKIGEAAEIPLPEEEGGETLLLSFTDHELWTGLQIVKTPGNWLVLTGAILMLIGLFISFYITPRRYWALVKESADGRSNVVIAGESFRNKVAFQREFKKTIAGLAQSRDQS